MRTAAFPPSQMHLYVLDTRGTVRIYQSLRHDVCIKLQVWMIQTHQRFERVSADGRGAAVGSFGATVASTEGVYTDKNNNWNRCFSCCPSKQLLIRILSRDFANKLSDHLSKLQNLLSTSSLRQIPQSRKVQLKQDKKKKSCNE